MNLLIVDDDHTVSDGLARKINREALHIDKIISAYSADDARAVFQTQPVDIILCDIEMPGENGVSLLEWVREHSPETLCIFLTSHSDFEYAQRGIRLGVYEYILQPAPVNTVETVLQRAVGQLEADRRMRRLSDYGGVLQKQKSGLVRSVVSDLLTESEQFYENTMQKLVQLAGDADFQHAPKLLLILPERREPATLDRDTKCFIISNILCEILGLLEDAVLYTWNESEEYIFIIFDANHLSESRLRFFQQTIDRILEGAYSIYAAECGEMKHENLQHTLARLRNVRRENVSGKEELRILYEGAETPKTDAALHYSRNLTDTKIMRWQKLLSEDDYDTVDHEISAFLLNAEIDNVSRKELVYIHENLVKCVIISLNEKNLNTTDFFESVSYTYEAFLNANNSISLLREGMSKILLAFRKARSHRTSDSEMVERVVSFVRENITSEISLQEIAAHVHFSPEYFSRKFRKETGIGIKEFILDEKFNYAKNALRNSSLPVNEIAWSIGYTNLPNFTYMFRKRVGMSPTDYRKAKKPR